MASAERIPLIRCPRCAERVIAPPPSSTGVWQCPFCRRRFRRRISASDSSGTIPCINLFSQNPWPLAGWPLDWQRNRFHPARWLSLGLSGYALVLVFLMVATHLAMTALALFWLAIRSPVLLLHALVADDDPDAEEPGSSPWLDPVRHWLPHFRRGDSDLRIGPILERHDAPGIFVLVAEMARKVGTREPDEVRIAYLPCCGVLEQRGLAGIGMRRRVLVLGLPLLYVLTIEELRAVVAHELAHLSRGDAAMAFVVSQFLDSLEQSIALPATPLGGWLNPCAFYARLVRWLFRILSSPLSRHQEYRADRLAALVCGSDVLARSLRNVALVQPVFKEVLCHYHPAVVTDANLYQFFRATWNSMSNGLKQEIQEALVADEEWELFGPHPRLRSRLGRLDRYPRHREPDERPARRLLLNRRRQERVLHDFLYRIRTPRLSLFQPPGAV